MNITQDDEGRKDRMALAKKCLMLVMNIAQRGVSSDDPENVGHAIQELTQVFVERTGYDEPVFEPVPVDQITDLASLNTELEFFDCASQDLSASESKAL